MKNKITKLLIALAFLMTAISLNAQQECATICHNGTLVKAVGANAIDGHLNHHSGDVLISTDCNYEITGNECNTLSLPKLDLKKPIEIGLNYYISDLLGRIYQIGKTDENFIQNLPKGGIFFINVETYQPLKRVL